jgi:hypothetical protein
LKKTCSRSDGFLLLATGRRNLVITKSNNKKKERRQNRERKSQEGTCSYSERFCIRDETTWQGAEDEASGTGEGIYVMVVGRSRDGDVGSK